MMNIPIDDGNALNTSMSRQVFGSDGYRVEIAEAQWFVSCMVTGWPHNGETILQLSIEDILGQFDGIPDG